MPKNVTKALSVSKINKPLPELKKSQQRPTFSSKMIAYQKCRICLQFVLLAGFLVAMFNSIQQLLAKETNISVESGTAVREPLQFPSLTFCPIVTHPKKYPAFVYGRNQTLTEFKRKIKPLENDFVMLRLILGKDEFDVGKGFE